MLIIQKQREASECEYHLQCLQEQRDTLDDYMKAGSFMVTGYIINTS